MNRLGYARYVAQGGDWGAMITDLMAAQAPPGLIGMHTNMAAVRAGFEIQMEKVRIRGCALKNDERFSTRHEAIGRPKRHGKTRTQRRYCGHNDWRAIRSHRLDVETRACVLLGIDDEPVIG
jgi:hypothetical protein